MAKRIEATQEQIEMHASVTEAFGLLDLDVIGQERDAAQEKLILTCVPRWPVALCPGCNELSAQVHDYPKQRLIHHVPVGSEGTLLYFDSRRFWCNRCDMAFTESVRDVVPECTYTYALAEMLVDARRKQDVATLARLYGLGYKLVESILLKAAEHKLAQRKQAPLVVKHLGIDEISLVKGQGRFVLVLTDLARRLVLDLLPDRRKQSLCDWLQTPPPGIELSALTTAAIDLWAPYRHAVEALFPEVAVVADRFHVMQNLHQAIHEIRRQAQRQADSDEQRNRLKGLRYLLLKNQANLSDQERQRLAHLQQDAPTLYRLWKLRQQFHDWYEREATLSEAAASLAQWIQRAQQLALAPLDAFCRTLHNWRIQILSFFVNRITSAFVEGMNNKIKLLKRIAFGIPNFVHFRLRILAACG